MKFNCVSKTDLEWVDKMENWHDFFALVPRRVASHECRWLEIIQRKGNWKWATYASGWKYEYRAKGDE